MSSSRLDVTNGNCTTGAETSIAAVLARHDLCGSLPLSGSTHSTMHAPQACGRLLSLLPDGIQSLLHRCSPVFILLPHLPTFDTDPNSTYRRAPEMAPRTGRGITSQSICRCVGRWLKQFVRL